jgi:hypothetical protein
MKQQSSSYQYSSNSGSGSSGAGNNIMPWIGAMTVAFFVKVGAEMNDLPFLAIIATWALKIIALPIYFGLLAVAIALGILTGDWSTLTSLNDFYWLGISK